jgi:hypothetical protein
MTVTDPRSRARSQQGRLVRPLLIGIALLVVALAAVAAIAARQAGAVPTNGQPCSRCHTQTATATVTLKVSATKVKPGTVVKVSGTVPSDHKWNKVTIQKRRGTNAWKLWKTVSITSSSTFSAKWTAPTTKGKYSFRAIYPGDNKYKRSVSPVRIVTVS